MHLIKAFLWSLERMLSSDIQLPRLTVRQVSITISVIFNKSVRALEDHLDHEDLMTSC